MEKKNKKEVTTLNEVVGIMLDAFQSNQEYMDKNFKQINENFREVNKKIDNISLDIVDIVRKDDFEKLEDRVTIVEEVLDLKLRKV